jgi:carbon starvation protein CstA
MPLLIWKVEMGAVALIPTVFVVEVTVPLVVHWAWAIIDVANKNVSDNKIFFILDYFLIVNGVIVRCSDSRDV